MFISEICAIDQIKKIHLIRFEKYSSDFILHIESEITEIWNGEQKFETLDLKTIKKDILNFIQNKTDKQKHGIISEFFCHIYLRKLGFQQYSIFDNLEENSMKKGFDGLYMDNNFEMFILESKSTLENTKMKSHPKNINKACKDLGQKIDGTNNQNNPWKNALNHANRSRIDPSMTLLKNLTIFSADFINKKYHKIQDFSIIPSSTIYFGDNIKMYELSDFENDLNSTINNYSFKSFEVICINKNSINEFITFLNE